LVNAACIKLIDKERTEMMNRLIHDTLILVALVAFAGSVAATDDFGSSQHDKEQVRKAMDELAMRYKLSSSASPGHYGRISFCSFRIPKSSWETHEAIEICVMNTNRTDAYLDDEEEWVRKEQLHRFNPQRQQVAGLTGLVLVPVKDADGYDKSSCQAYGVFRDMVLVAASAQGCPRTIELVGAMRDKLSPLTHVEDPRTPSNGEPPPQPGEMPLPPSLR
jgi:hypothetical protein